MADTRYWLELSSSIGRFNWDGSVPGITPTGISGITYSGGQFTLDGGSNYTSSATINTFQINATAASATAVPEPTNSASYIVFFGSLWAGRKLLKSRAAKKES